MWYDIYSPLRWIIRGVGFFFQSTIFLVPTVLLQSRFGRFIGLDEWALKLWSNGTCRAFGIRPKVSGKLLDGPVVVVANHISWADIQAMHSVGAMSFVAKAEIGTWPLFGFLARAGGTVFHQRGSHDSAAGAMQQVMAKLEASGRVAVFPEGGVHPGEHIKRFHARMFKVAVEAECPVQPAMIRYVRDGQRDPDVTFINGENFMVNLLRLMGRPACRCELVFLPPLDAAGQPRNELARQTESSVKAAYDAPVDITS